jgi:hypothetical protein
MIVTVADPMGNGRIQHQLGQDKPMLPQASAGPSCAGSLFRLLLAALHLARFGRTPPTRAGRLADASVDPIEARH